MILLPDLQTRKGFDVFQICKRHFKLDEMICAASVQHPLLRLSYPTNLARLRSTSFDVFESDMKNLLSNRTDVVVFMPVEESTVVLYLDFKRKYPASLIDAMLPNTDTFALSRDKLRLAQYCETIGISVPSVYTDVPTKDKLPLVLKPNTGSGSEGIRYLNSPTELDLFGGVTPEGCFFQECISGSKDVIGAFFLCLNGSVVSSYAHQRIRTYPESGGVTVYSESVDNERVLEIGAKLLGQLNWSGLAMVEFLWSETHNDYVVIEINPRLWGSVLLSELVESHMISNYVRLCRNEIPVTASRFKYKKLWWFVLDTVLLLKKGRFRTWVNTVMTPGKGVINWTYASVHSSIVFHSYTMLTNRKAASLIR